MGVPYEARPMAAIAVDAVPVVVTIDWPDKSVISKIIVVQTEGVMADFTVGLYNHSQVLTGEFTSDSTYPDVGRLPDDVYRVTHEIESEAAGKLLYFSDRETGGYGFVFRSAETKDNRPGQRNGKLYLKITPASPGAKKFAVAIGGVKEVE